jgi:hypothetical protein
LEERRKKRGVEGKERQEKEKKGKNEGKKKEDTIKKRRNGKHKLHGEHYKMCMAPGRQTSSIFMAWNMVWTPSAPYPGMNLGFSLGHFQTF